MTMHESSPRSIGILGAGRVGTAVARRAVAAGFDTVIATSKPVAEIALLVEVVTPGARAGTARDVAAADIIVVAVPLPRFKNIDASLFKGKIVIDAMNYWAPTDGELTEFEQDMRSTSEVVADHFAGSQLVKTINHIGYHDLDDDWRAAGAADRRALAIAGDDDAANEQVAQVIDRFGFAPVQAGPLAAGRSFQPGTEIFNGAHSEQELIALLEQAYASANA